jgi:hypothetical protein
METPPSKNTKKKKNKSFENFIDEKCLRDELFNLYLSMCEMQPADWVRRIAAALSCAVF